MKNNYTTVQYRNKQLQIFQILEDSLKVKSVSNLSLSKDIISCGVSKPTFYKHFANKNDLLQAYARHLFDFILGPKPESHPAHMEDALTSMLSKLKANKERLHVLVAPGNSEHFLPICYNIISESLKTSGVIANHLPDVTDTFYYDYHSAGTFSVLYRWITLHPEWPAERIASNLLTLYCGSTVSTEN